MVKKKSAADDALELIEKAAGDIAMFQSVISVVRYGAKLDASSEGGIEIQQICQREIALLERTRKEAEAKLRGAGF